MIFQTQHNMYERQPPHTSERELSRQKVNRSVNILYNNTTTHCNRWVLGFRLVNSHITRVHTNIRIHTEYLTSKKQMNTLLTTDFRNYYYFITDNH